MIPKPTINQIPIQTQLQFLFNYTDNTDPIFLQSSIKSNASGKQNIMKVLQIGKQYHVLFTS